MTQSFYAIGLMSGTSADGIDAVLLKTDGHDQVEVLSSLSHRYPAHVQHTLSQAYGIESRDHPAVKIAEEISTNAHIAITRELIEKSNITPDLIGYHGQTTLHRPQDKLTIQLGDGKRMARELGIKVVYNMRANDVSLGGQGAPFAPLYHRTLVSRAQMPAVILNIGGVSNITYIDQNNILAFDTGPGNALMDDLIKSTADNAQTFDNNGALAATGTVDKAALNTWLSHPFFAAPPPKSLDRDAWKALCDTSTQSVPDALATLNAFTAHSIAKSCDFLPTQPVNWYVSGGGRHNKTLMQNLQDILPGNVQNIDVLNWNGDTIEAEIFAYLAVRSYLGLPLSLPETTGVPYPATGGVLATPV